MPSNSQASSAALFAPRHVEAALCDAIKARAMKMSTCLWGYSLVRVKGVGILSMEKMVLKDVIAERYVAFVPYDVPKNIRYVANQMTPIGQRSRVSVPHIDIN